MKIITAVGARSQFIKAAAGLRVFKNYFEEIVVHPGSTMMPICRTRSLKK